MEFVYYLIWYHGMFTGSGYLIGGEYGAVYGFTIGCIIQFLLKIEEEYKKRTK